MCLSNTDEFQSLAFDALGPINYIAISFISELGRRIEQVTGDRLDLSCHLVYGRLARRQDLNNLIWRALSSVGVPCTKEPVGFLRFYGKAARQNHVILCNAG